MVERKSPEGISAPVDHPEWIAQHIESDFKIRSGLCPNNCGLMTENSYGQECPSCGFSCNTPAEKVVPQ